ncbi:MAG: DUF4332 domain-containing protein [Promethearchaeota archaeon]
MDEEGFASYLKKKGKTPRTIKSCVENARTFENFLKNTGKSAMESEDADLNQFVSSVLAGNGVAKFMWTLQHYFSFIGNKELLTHSQKIREVHTAKKRQPFKLRDFKGVNQDAIEKLAKVGIHSVDDMIQEGRTKKQRKDLAAKIGVKSNDILELAKLSDLTRLGAVKAVRARLYHDSGFDTIGKIAATTPEELIRITRDFIEKTGFQGIPPLPKEAANVVRTAKKLSAQLEL